MTPFGRPLHRCVRVRASVALAVLAGLATGCEQSTMDKVSENESILGFLPSQPTPADAARWSQDPYDADKRFRGTNLLANAPFGGEDVYVQTYRMKLGAPPAEAPDPDSGVRGVAARALSLHGAPQDALLIIPLLKDPDRRVRLEAVRALQRIHNPKAVDPLLIEIDDAKETDYDVRAEAATALGQYAETRVLQGLIGALDDDYLAVTRAASVSLTTLTGQELGEDQRAWLAWMKDNKTPFAGRREYLYPVFHRDLYWFEHMPFVGQPLNETAAAPVGMGGEPSAPVVATGVAPAPATAASATNAPAISPTPATTSAAAQVPAPSAPPSGAPASTAVASTAAPAAAPGATGPQPRPEPLPEVPTAPATVAGTTPTTTPPAPVTPPPPPASPPPAAPPVAEQPKPPAPAPTTPPASGPGFTPGEPVTPAPRKP